MKESTDLEMALQLELQRSQAMLTPTSGELAALFSDDLYYGHSGGYSDNKETFLEKFNKGVYAYDDVNLEVRAVSRSAEMLVINGKVNIRVTLHGIKKNMDSIYLAVWRMENGNWRFLAHQTALQAV